MIFYEAPVLSGVCRLKGTRDPMSEYASTSTLASKRHALRPAPLPGLIALAACTGGLVLATHHPLSPVVATAFVLVASLAFFSRAHWWLLLLPALLPVIGLAPWTGWITFEEQDMLVLAAAAGGYARKETKGSIV